MDSILLDTALKGAAILGAAWLLAIFLRGRSAAARHLVWTAAWAAVLALPFLSVSMPALRVTAPSGIVFHTTATASSDYAPLPSAVRSATTPVPQKSYLGSWLPASRLLRPSRTDFWLMLLWAAGAAAAFAKILFSYISIWRIRRSARPLPEEVAFGIRRRVRILETSAGTMPMTFGVIRPVIFMPADAARWPKERRRMVILHEFAHVRRNDAAAQIMARIALALHWWNPLAWIAWREFLKERERAADDVVLNATLNSGARASDYAAHLLDLARAMQPAPVMAAGFARRSHLETRVSAILDARINRKSPGRAWAAAAIVLALAGCAPLAAVHAQESQPQLPADVDAAIRSANSQKNYKILDDDAKAAVQLRKYDIAKKLLESAASIRAAVSGDQSADYGIGLLKLGDIEQKLDEKIAAKDFYARAVPLLGNRPEAAPALMYLGVEALAKQPEQAMGDFDRARRADPTQSGRALMWMALTQQHDNKPGDAEKLFQSALSSQNPTSLDAAITMTIYAQFLKQQKRDDEAKQMDSHAASIKAKYSRNIKVTSGVYKIGPGIVPPKVLQKIDPIYTEEARAARLQGTVGLQLVIGTDGLARDFVLKQPLGLGLDAAAIEAVSQWHFEPGTKDGQPVPVVATIEVNFRLL